MQLQISASGMTPIYEQIASQIRRQIQDGLLLPETCLPSVRTVAKDCRISALTVKKAYDLLESEGLVQSVQGKGTFVCQINASFIEERTRQKTEEMLEKAIENAKAGGLSQEEVRQMFDLLMEEYG